MSNPPEHGLAVGWRARVDELARERPDWVMMAPYMTYLLLLALRDQLPPEWNPLAAALRGIGGMAVVWLFWRHFPPFGRLHLPLAVVAAAASTVLWVGGQHLFNALGIPMWLPLPLFTPQPIVDPRAVLGDGTLLWTSVVMRIAVATITVAFVEEIFWRGFLLRAFVNWGQFERVPPGTFTWISFAGTALLSTLQHPSNWLVSIFLWLAWNGLFLWKRSLSLMIATHGLTNLMLYVYVVTAQDWMFW